MEIPDNLNEIVSSLSTDDIEMLKGVAASILGESGSAPDSSAKSGNASNPLALNTDSIDFNMIMKAKTIFDKMNNTPNKNADLIMALKPHLSPQIQNRADQAVRILKLFEILPLLKELF